MVPLERFELPSNDYKSLILAFILKGHYGADNGARTRDILLGRQVL